MKDIDLARTYIGKVEDNNDPSKLGRCRIRVLDIFDNIPTEDIPWASPHKDANGNQFYLPDVGKIVSVYFDNENLYTPVYRYAQHYNINLETKLSELDGENYTSMRSIVFDHKTQMFSNDLDGLMMDYKFNQINIKNDVIDVNCKDNRSIINLGTPNSTQEAILGTNFLEWFDEFVDNLLGSKGGPYLGNLGAPVIANPDFIQVLIKYKTLKDPKFLSDNVMLVDNGYVSETDRIENSQIGDEWTSTIEENELTTKNAEPSNRGKNIPDGWTPEGQLTTTGDGIPQSEPNSIVGGNDTNSNNQIPPDGDISEDTEVLLRVLKDKGYKIYDKPYQLNTIGVRYQYQGQNYSNVFKDRLYAIWKDDKGNWKNKYWKISTIPGLFKRKKQNLLLKDYIKEKSPGRGGLGILKPSQYINVYEIGKYGDYPAMRSIGKQLAYRDQNYGSKKITFSNEDPANSKGGSNFYMHIHKGFPNGSGVNSWSEGCQVFNNESSLREYFAIASKHKQRYGNRFTYTLITSVDVNNTTEKIKAEKNL